MTTCDNYNSYGSETQDERLTGKDVKWDAKRYLTQLVEEHFQKMLETKTDPHRQKKLTAWLSRLTECTTWLEFLKFQDLGTEEITRKLNRASFCRVRSCPVCQWRRSMKARAKFYRIAPQLVRDFPRSRFIFLTLTVKNCRPWELRETIKAMNHAWTKMIRTRKWERTMQGYAKSIEVTRNPRDNTAHPHFHVLLMVDESYFSKKKIGAYYTQQEFRSLWQKSLRVDYEPLVNIKAVKQDQLAKAFIETTKYMTKSEDLLKDIDFFYEYIFQTDGLRFLSSGGVLRQLLSDLEDDADLINVGGDEDEEPAFLACTELFAYNYDKHYYTKTF